MKQEMIAALVAAALAAGSLGAQEPASAEARARATLPPDVFEGVSALAAEARGFDVPAEPL
ncbi:MAG TPA: hypothetical protein VFQ22_04960, partial [Longimicrobiales bacterium]|nr:hypothetical protein [Longimicrobiales bacterium]